jgi:HEAT repeat protein
LAAKILRESVVREAVARSNVLEAADKLTVQAQRWLAEFMDLNAVGPRDWGLQSADGTVRRTAYLRRLQSGDPASVIRLAEKMLADRSPVIRRLGVEALSRSGGSADRLLTAAVDRNRQVRLAARTALPDTDFRSFYREHLNCAGGVEGIGEVGESQDLPRLRAALTSPTPAIRRAACGSIASLGGREEAPDLARMLADPTPSVARAALRALNRVGATLDSDALYSLAKDANRQLGVRRNAVWSLCLVSRWDELNVLVRLNAEPDLRPSVHSMLGRWVQRAKIGLPLPSRNRVADAEATLAEYGGILPGELRTEIDAVLRWTAKSTRLTPA